jgi:hypothetical protein
MSSLWRCTLSLVLFCLAVAPFAPSAQQALSSVDPMHRPFDQLLDLYVRDGFVYYAAVKSDRAKLDRYLVALDAAGTPAAYSKWSREQQIAFWVNAYNAHVIRAVVEHYPIHGRAPEYPANSIRQIPGVFDRIPRRIGGRSLTLDAIEKTILPGFRDPRLFLALGRAAVSSGRLHSEAYTAEKLEIQLKRVATEFATQGEFFHIDRLANRVLVSPIVGWHEAEFIGAFDPGASSRFANRSPVERAILAFVEPNLLPGELGFLSQNDFRVSYSSFDWHLNDLTGGRLP